MTPPERLPKLLVDTLELLAVGESPEQITIRLHRTPGAIARAAYRAGLTDLARPFAALDIELRRRRARHE